MSWHLANPSTDTIGFVPPSSSVSDLLAKSEATNDGESSSLNGRLVLSGLKPSTDDSSPVSWPEVVSEVELPVLRQGTISPQLVDQMVELAGEYPEEQRLRSYVAQAYLMLGLRRFTDERHREALAYAAEAEIWGAPPQEVARLSARACLALQDLGDAREWAESALAFGSDAVMYDVLGNVHYLREEMAKAIDAWKQSLSIQDDPRVRVSLEKALRELKVAGGFDRQRLSHFIVRYEGETMENTGRLVMGSLEKSYSFLKSRLSFEPSEPIVVLLYTRREYAELGGPTWSAGLFDGKVRVPVRGLVSLDRQVETIMRHELTHAFLYARAGKNCPRWLHEGMAEYCEGIRADQFGKMLADKITEDGNLAYCLMAQRCEVSHFYRASLSLVEYMMKNRGLGGIRNLLTTLGEGKTIDQALQEVYGRDEMGLINEWQNFIRRRYY